MSKELLLSNKPMIQFRINSLLESIDNGVYAIDCFFQVPAGRGFKKDQLMLTVYKVGEWGVNAFINVDTLTVESAKTQGKYNKEDTKSMTNIAYWLYIFHIEKALKNIVSELTTVETQETIEETIPVAATIETVVTEEPTQTTNETNNTYTAYNRSFSSYEGAYDYCIHSDFDPAFIVTEAPSEPLKLDLQLFASTQHKAPRTLYESDYDSVKILTTQGEYIVRIHPSEHNDTQHEIFFSSDDSFPINDTDIISVERIYKKVVITPEGVRKWGIGKGLELIYIITTTKTDIELDELYFSNVHKYTFNSIQSALESFNRMQKLGYNNIQIIAEIQYKDNTIIEDTSDINIELDINTQVMMDLKRDNKELHNSNDTLLQELEIYQAFMSKYNAKKTFETFKEDYKNKNNKAS